MNGGRLDELINAWLDNAATDAEHAELEARLLEDDTARSRFWYLSTLHGMTVEAANLHWGIPEQAIRAAADQQPPASPAEATDAAVDAAHVSAADGTASGKPAESHTAISPPVAPLSAWLSANMSSPRALGTIVLVGLATYFGSLLLAIIWQHAWEESKAPRTPAMVAPSPAVAGQPSAARLVFADQCQWEENAYLPVVGQRLVPCRLHLLRGIAEVEFSGGARVRISGPTRFSLRSDALGFLEEGRLSAQVPARARGFTIETPTARLIDLGTAFVVEVARTTTRMAVTEGAVEVVPVEPSAGAAGGYVVTGAAHRLTLGQAMTVTRSDSGSVMAEAEPFDAAWVERCPAPSDPLQLSPAADLQDVYYRSLMGTADLVAYWRLAEMGGQFARDEVGRDSSPGGLAPGIYRNMRSVNFRQPGPFESGTASAVRFDGTNYVEVVDRSRRLIGDWDGLSVAAWINPADVDTQHLRMIAGTWACLVSQDQFSLLQMADHLAFSVADGKTAESGTYSTGALPLVARKWSFIVGTWDKPARRLRLYVNGQDDTRAGDDQQAGSGINQNSITSFCIGSQPGQDRAFVGLIDEVAVFKRCLSPREIAQMFAAAALATDADREPQK